MSDQDQLSIMRKEVKLKKLLFSELPSNYSLFKQYNIMPKEMFENLLALHAVDGSNQDSISVEDIYEITDSLTSLSMEKPKQKAREPVQGAEATIVDLE